jgi:putative transposase
MPRRNLIRSDVYPYHVTNRSNNKEFFYLEKSEVWKIFLEVLSEIEQRYCCQIHAFVLMSNHYHILMSTPKANIGESMKYFHREVAKQANKKMGRNNHFFGGRYKWSLITTENYYWNCVKYILRNPVRAKICNKVEDYEFSTLNLGSNNRFKIKNFFVSEEIDLDLVWLNQSQSTEQEELLKKAIRRTEFGWPRSKSCNLFKIELDTPFRKKVTVT